MARSATIRGLERGPLEIGEDLMSFEIGPAITVRRDKHMRVY